MVIGREGRNGNKLSYVSIDYGLDLLLREVENIEFNATIMFMATSSGEGADRNSLDFSFGERTFAEHIHLLKSPGKKILHMTVPSAVITNSFRDNFDAMLLSVMPGVMAGDAIKSVLFGYTSPAGKLTFTMPNKNNEQEMKREQYPGLNFDSNVTYTEGHHFGYRWYDAHNVTPAFAFGHGLTYGKFECRQSSIC